MRRKAYASLGDRVASEHDILAEAGALLSAVSGAGTTGSAASVLVGASLLALTPAAVVENGFAVQPTVDAALLRTLVAEIRHSLIEMRDSQRRRECRRCRQGR